MKKKLLPSLFLMFSLVPDASAMHIMEGYLPAKWCLIWYLISLPFVVMSYFSIKKLIKGSPKKRLTMAMAGAYVFILSALKLPSVEGSSSHLTGTTLGTLTLGPRTLPLIGVIVLLFQALLLAHGGVTTLGANVFSMTIVGPYVAYFIYYLCQKIKCPSNIAIFLATFFGSLSTYVTTSFQLAIVYPEQGSGVLGAAFKFLSIFAITQIPLSIIEGIITVIIIRILKDVDVPLIRISKKTHCHE